MSDTLSKKERSARMALVRGKNTGPENKMRGLVRSMRYRFRSHVKSLPGTPDFVFPTRKAVVFVHGCFWHRHKRCALARLPKSRLHFWLPKLEANRLRDQKALGALRHLGWRPLVVWECEINEVQHLRRRLRTFLSKARARA